MSRAKPLSDFLWALSGPLVWAMHFFSIYAAEALICTAAVPLGKMMQLASLILTGAALLALFGIVVYRQRLLPAFLLHAVRDLNEFLAFLTLLLIALSALAVIWAAMPGFMLPVCSFSPG